MPVDSIEMLYSGQSNPGTLDHHTLMVQPKEEDEGLHSVPGDEPIM